MGASDSVVGWTTVATEEESRLLAAGLLEKGLAACVQVDAPVRSCYQWKGELREEEEIRLWVKTTEHYAQEIGDFFAASHPYETPQWVWVRYGGGSDEYLNWIRGSLQGDQT